MSLAKRIGFAATISLMLSANAHGQDQGLAPPPGSTPEPMLMAPDAPLPAPPMIEPPPGITITPELRRTIDVMRLDAFIYGMAENRAKAQAELCKNPFAPAEFCPNINASDGAPVETALQGPAGAANSSPDQKSEPPPLPTVIGYGGLPGQMTADIRYANGTVGVISAGYGLPGGYIVEEITSTGVYVRGIDGHTLIALPMAGRSQQPGFNLNSGLLQ